MLPAGWKIKTVMKGDWKVRPGEEAITKLVKGSDHIAGEGPLTTAIHFETGNRMKSYQMDSSESGRRRLAGKVLNNRARTINGNSVPQIKIIHWNLGSHLWNNKTDDIEVLMNEKKTDLCFVA